MLAKQKGANMLIINPKITMRGSKPTHIIVSDSWREFTEEFKEGMKGGRRIIRSQPVGMKGFDYVQAYHSMAQWYLEYEGAYVLPPEYFSLAISMMKLDRALIEGNPTPAQAKGMQQAIRAKLVDILKKGKWIEDPTWISQENPEPVRIFLDKLKRIDLGYQASALKFEAMEQEGKWKRDQWFRTRAAKLGIDDGNYFVTHATIEKLLDWSLEKKEYTAFERRFPEERKKILRLKENAGAITKEEVRAELAKLRQATIDT